MDKLTRHYRKLKAVFLISAFGVIAAALFALPTSVRWEASEENIFQVYLNGTDVGSTDDPEQMEELLWQAREELVRDSREMVFMDADLTFEGRACLFGTINGERSIRANMKEVLEGSVRQTLQRAFTVKINEYTVNLRTSKEVLTLLQECLNRYDPEGEYAVDLVVDPDRELNVLTTSIRPSEQEQEQTRLCAGLDAFLNEAMETIPAQAQPTGFEEIDYGLVDVAYADTVEVVEAYLMEDEITPLKEAIDQVTKEQEKEQIYEVQSGDTLSQIALNNGLTVEGLVDINPALEDENATIRPGDELVITVPEPELSVLHRELVYEEDSYEAPVEYVDVDEWYTTKTEVIQEPSAGFRRTASIKTFRNEEEIGEEIILEDVEFEAVPKIVKRGTKVPPTYIKPISGGRISSSFGRRNAPTRGASTNHHGVDWAIPVGTAVMASSGGTVTRAGWGGGYGYVVYVQHADGRETRYAHLSKILVSVGEHVDQGEKIALTGNTGRSTGPHLHFELRINGVPVNPYEHFN